MTDISAQHGHFVVGPAFFDRFLQSLYPSRDVFLRELLGNSQAALRKRELLDAVFAGEGEVAAQGRIEIRTSRTERWIEVSDNGAGIKQGEFETVLPRVGETGTGIFREQQEQRGDLSEVDRRKLREMVGYFGVGLYSGFLVAEEIHVTSRPFDEDQSLRWTAYRDTRWKLESVQTCDVGTTVRLENVAFPEAGQEDPAEESYLAELVQRWADYCPYPIYVGGQIKNRRLTPWDDAGRPSKPALLDCATR